MAWARFSLSRLDVRNSDSLFFSAIILCSA